MDLNASNTNNTSCSLKPTNKPIKNDYEKMYSKRKVETVECETGGVGGSGDVVGISSISCRPITNDNNNTTTTTTTSTTIFKQQKQQQKKYSSTKNKKLKLVVNRKRNTV